LEAFCKAYDSPPVTLHSFARIKPFTEKAFVDFTVASLNSTSETQVVPEGYRASCANAFD